jgi:hypothetical protein
MKRLVSSSSLFGAAVSSRVCSTAAAEPPVTPPPPPKATAAADGGSDSGARKRTEAEVKEDMIKALISKDKEVFELKRLHELSMLRVEQLQNRILKDQQDRGIYYEQNSNVHTFDTISVGQYTQRNTLHHMIGLEKLRNFKIYCAISASIYTCLFLYYRYIINPDMAYVEVPIAVMGDTRKMLGNYYAQLREEKYAEDMAKWK